ncbi:UDP-glucuronosyl/UDP-glucosyltransferase [Tanacetum coccineum]
MDGKVHTYKARLFVKGYTQTHMINYEEIFSPVAKIKSIRIMLTIAAFHDYEIWQMDVKTTFLNGKLTEDVFMAQPEGFENQKSEDESCVYVKVNGSVVVFLVLYVDDIPLIGNDIPMLQSVKDWLGRCFSMKDLGDATYILGIKIYRDRTKRLIGLSQDMYLDKILKRFRIKNSKKGDLPLQHGIKISKDLYPKTNDELDKMSRVLYASAIGSIMYAMTCTRPDVSFALSMVSRHQQNPGEGHWTTVKNILRYLRNTKDRFLVYGGEKELKVTGYCDAGWQTDKDDHGSQSGWSSAVALDHTLCLVDQDRVRPIIVNDLSKWETVGFSVQGIKNPSLPTMDKEVEGEFVNLPEPVKVPGCNPIQIQDLLDQVQDRKIDEYKWYLFHVSRLHMTTGIFVNTWDDLEPVSLKVVKYERFFKNIPMPPVYPVGPLTKQIEPVVTEHEKEIKAWLDKQPNDSVLFVALRSGGTLTSEQQTELAWGLELGQQRFILVVQKMCESAHAAFFHAGSDSDDPKAYLPKGFVDRINGVGLVVSSWAPQLRRDIKSINWSIYVPLWVELESVKHGVPMIGWPMYVEQRMNATILSKEVGVAVKMLVVGDDGETMVVGREEIERVVRAVMEGEEGNKIRSRAKEVEASGQATLSHGGSSYEKLAQVAHPSFFHDDDEGNPPSFLGFLMLLRVLVVLVVVVVVERIVVDVVEYVEIVVVEDNIAWMSGFDEDDESGCSDISRRLLIKTSFG